MNKKILKNKDEKTMACTGSASQETSATTKLVESLLMKPDKSKRPKTFAVERSNVLDRVKAFLPQLQESNAKLEAVHTDLNIENISDDCKDSYIEMTLACVEESEALDKLSSDVSSDDDSDNDSDQERGDSKSKDEILNKKCLIEEL